ncbi:DUF1684 domain-containing protein [Streptomyces gobiensis]|uniref:DUF1684 domain-containing protein n=1 Tax=Streptomyces gobiensis TaxID=2875706 RepID=UPI001E4D82E9|nr:DUF1684 domain-containing protein [Streptomyces gobiensis]UGY90587.1 DUF1684 domain-containing protein [Streptomyces gobiensis]
MNSETTSAAQLWQEWHQQRLDTVTAPYGPLSVTGTYWIADADDEGRIEGVPGQWRETADGTAVVLRADIMDGLAVDGELLVGEITLSADREGPGQSRVSYGERRLELLWREGQWAVRVHDPDSATRRSFTGIETGPYNGHWVLRGVFHPYSSERSVHVMNTDGHERGLKLGGELRFTTPDGGEHTLQVSVVGSGALWAVFADGTSGRGSYRFRFLRTGAPAADGSVTVDFNRATLPPCAFSDHFLCPFPPPGNTLETDIPVGERDIAG